MKTLQVRLTLTEEMLGMTPNDIKIWDDFQGSKAPDAKSDEERIILEGMQAFMDRQTCVFPRENGKPLIWDYQIKGMFKDTCGMLWRVPGTKSNKLKAYKKVIDGTIFVEPRKIFPILPEGGAVGDCQRPLRAQTPQGERVSLAKSETIPAGTVVEFDIVLLDEGHEKLVEEWLDYGKLRGLGQWRNSGKGRFTWERR